MYSVVVISIFPFEYYLVISEIMITYYNKTFNNIFVQEINKNHYQERKRSHVGHSNLNNVSVYKRLRSK